MESQVKTLRWLGACALLMAASATIWRPLPRAKALTSNSVHICYVSPLGSDANDGMTLATAKLHIMEGCYDSMYATYGGTAATGSILIYDAGTAATGAPVSTVPGCGIWLMTARDPNYTAPPACWRKAMAHVEFLGMSGTSVGNNSPAATFISGCGGSTDNNHPCIWLSGLQGQANFRNLIYQYPNTGMKIGIDSNGARSTSGVAGVIFDNIQGVTNAAVGAGPNVDIGSGSFWLEFRDCSFVGNDYVNGVLNARGAAISINPGTSGTLSNGYLIKFTGTTHLTYGGIYWNRIAGNAGPWSEGYIEHIDSENLAPGNALIYFPNVAGQQMPNRVTIMQAENFDAGAGAWVVRYDGPTVWGQGITHNHWGVQGYDYGPILIDGNYLNPPGNPASNRYVDQSVSGNVGANACLDQLVTGWQTSNTSYDSNMQAIYHVQAWALGDVSQGNVWYNMNVTTYLKNNLPYIRVCNRTAVAQTLSAMTFRVELMK
jgi:hypothetical protein